MHFCGNNEGDTFRNNGKELEKKKHSKDVLNIFTNIVPETLFPHSIFHTLPVDGVLKPTNYFGTIAAEAGRLITAFIAKSAASSQSCERNEKQTMVFWCSIFY